jgi:heme-degrading monooxygenase HmoA
MAAAADVEGFLGIETCVQPGFSLAVSFWSSLDAIDTWRRHPTHGQAKAQGMSRWFAGYATRIAQVIDQY